MLRGQNRYRDLLQLKIGDVIDKDGNMKARFWLREAKRGKRHEVILNDSIREALAAYRNAYPQVEDDPDHFLFFNTRTNDYLKPISRKQAWKFVADICHDVGLSGNFGTHSLRKTWGYHARMNGVDLALIMHKLNHNSLAYTRRYSGITDDELEAVVRRLNL